jgi:hypothetical protein
MPQIWKKKDLSIFTERKSVKKQINKISVSNAMLVPINDCLKACQNQFSHDKPFNNTFSFCVKNDPE